MENFNSCCYFLAFFSKISIWVMLSIIPITILIFMKKENPKIIFFRSVPLLVYSGILIGTMIFLKSELFTNQLNLLLDYQFTRLNLWRESYFSIFLFQIHPIITTAAIYSIFVAFRKRDMNYLIIIWIISLFLYLNVARARYLLPAYPFLALMSSYGIHEIKNRNFREYLVFGIVASSIILLLFAYVPFIMTLSPINIKSAGDYLDTLNATEFEVYSVVKSGTVYNPEYTVPLLDLYTDKDIIFSSNGIFKPPNEKIMYTWAEFTWDLKIPDYYSPQIKNNYEKRYVIVLSQSSNQIYPTYLEEKLKRYTLTKEFNKTSNRLYVFRTIVKFYAQKS